jgi:hypothetical protein
MVGVQIPVPEITGVFISTSALVTATKQPCKCSTMQPCRQARHLPVTCCLLRSTTARPPPLSGAAQICACSWCKMVHMYDKTCCTVYLQTEVLTTGCMLGSAAYLRSLYASESASCCSSDLGCNLPTCSSPCAHTRSPATPSLSWFTAITSRA